MDGGLSTKTRRSIGAAALIACALCATVLLTHQTPPPTQKLQPQIPNTTQTSYLEIGASAQALAPYTLAQPTPRPGHRADPRHYGHHGYPGHPPPPPWAPTQNLQQPNGETLTPLIKANTDNPWRWGLLVTSCLLGSAGIALVVMDLRETHRAGKPDAQDQFLTSVINTAPHGIVIVDEKGTIEVFNPAAEKLFGYHASEAVGNNVSILMPETEVADNAAPNTHFLWQGDSPAFGVDREVYGRRKDGTLALMDLAVSEMWDGERRLFHGSIRCASARRTEHQRIREGYDRLEQALAATGDGLWDWDLQTGHVYLSRQFRRLLGHNPNPKDDDIAKLDSLEKFLHRNDRQRIHQALEQHFVKQVPFDQQIRLRTKSGEFRWFRARGQAARDKQGNPKRVIGWLTDITIQKQNEADIHKRTEELVDVRTMMEAQAIELATKAEQLEISRAAAEDANRAKSEFLANMSHEIRTPMTAILGYTEFLLDADDNPPDTEAHLQTIRRNGHHLLTLINDILDFSKIEAGRMTIEQTPFRLDELLDDVADLLRGRADQKNIDFTIERDPRVPAAVRSDPTRIRQILINLIGNAIKFTEHGSVTLAVATDDSDQTNTLINFDVQDTGVGITPEQQDKLFSAFTQADGSTTRKFGGSGLGLCISKHLAQLLGGDIHLQSTIGRGSTFTLRIPLQQLDPAETPTDVAHRLPDGDPNVLPALDGHVLLVDDAEDNRRLISLLLTKSGATVSVATDGHTATRMALNQDPDSTPYDLILMDMQMPGQDGYQTTRHLRENGYKGPIIALTAHALADSRDQCVNAGCDDFASKPIDRVKLLSLASDYIRKYRLEVAMGSDRPDQGADAPAPDHADAAPPLYSDYASDPDMAELVEMFVSDLANRTQALDKAAKNLDLDTITHLSHQLKGAAGGYGFTPITESAATLEKLAKNNADEDSIRQAANDLISLCRRATNQPRQEAHT